MPGSLTVVGLGIKLGAQITAEARASIEDAQAVFFLAADPVAYFWMPKLNPAARSLHTFYKPGKDRSVCYDEMVDHVLQHVRRGLRVCFASYGHPGVLGTPLHKAVTTARDEGYPAIMFPAVSAEDCLFADLGIDPGKSGCQSFEATDFLVYRRSISTSTPLILWQIGLIGEPSFKHTWEAWKPKGFRVLCDVLAERYGRRHNVIIYEAAQYSITTPRIESARLSDLPNHKVTVLSTLYVPPKNPPKADERMCRRLGIRRKRQQRALS